jgi:hypothetical protein
VAEFWQKSPQVRQETEELLKFNNTCAENWSKLDTALETRKYKLYGKRYIIEN